MWIKGFEGKYKIFRNGIVFNVHAKRVVGGSVNSYGYRVVRLRKGNKNYDFKVHRLLAQAFIPNPNGYDCVNHIDGNKLNNSLDNLEWCTRSYNNRHARKQLGYDFSEKPVEQSTLNGDFVAIWRNASLAAKVLGFSATTISSCCRGTQASAYDYLWKFSDFCR